MQPRRNATDPTFLHIQEFGRALSEKYIVLDGYNVDARNQIGVVIFAGLKGMLHCKTFSQIKLSLGLSFE